MARRRLPLVAACFVAVGIGGLLAATNTAYAANGPTSSADSVATPIAVAATTEDAMALTAGPTVTTLTRSTSTLSGAVLVSPSDSRLTYRGAANFAYGTGSPNSSLYLPSSKYPHSYGSQSSWSVEFVTDAAEFQVLFKSQPSSMYRVLVNGRRATDEMQPSGGTETGGLNLLDMSFGTAVQRDITIEFYSTPFGGIYLPSGSTLSATAPYNVRWAVLGDSISGGSAYDAGYAGGTWVNRVALLLNWQDPFNEAIGGTGYVNAGTAAKFADRVSADVVAYNPQKVVVWGGYNDATSAQSAIATQASAVYAALKQGLPSASIFVIGCWSPRGTPATGWVNTNNTLKAAAAAAGLAFISPVDGNVYNGAGQLVTTLGPWITGSGHLGAPTGSGNADTYIGGDGVHPTDAGHAYLARRIATSIGALDASQHVASGIDVTWQASASAASYQVYRSPTAGFTPGASTLVATVSGTSYVDPLPAPGTYYYRIVAQDTSGDSSAPSDAASATVTDSTAPGPVTSATASVAGSAVSLSWTPATDDVGVTGYTVYRSSTSGFAPSASTLVGTTSGTTFGDAPPAGNWYYLVAARDAAGNQGTASTQVSAKVAGATTTVTVSPTADTYANQSAASTNYGSSSSMAVRGKSGQIAYLRFVLPSAPSGSTLTSAVLTVHTSSTADAPSANTETVTTASDSWTENGLTWNNRPTLGTTTLGTLTGATAANTPYPINLSTSALSTLTGSETTVAITGSSTDSLWLWSNNYAGKTARPSLVLTYTASS